MRRRRELRGLPRPGRALDRSPTSRPDATHADNVAHGLYPTNDPVAQARLCLSCHFGNKDKFVTHRMMGAGHPRISFELDTFAQTAAAALRDRRGLAEAQGQLGSDARLGHRAGARRLGAARRAARSEAQPRRPLPRAGGVRLPRLPPPDVGQALDAAHRASSPGRIRLNDSNLLMLRQIVRRVLPADDANAFADARATCTRPWRATAATRSRPRAKRARRPRRRDRPARDALLHQRRPARHARRAWSTTGSRATTTTMRAPSRRPWRSASLLNFLGKRGDDPGRRAAPTRPWTALLRRGEGRREVPAPSASSAALGRTANDGDAR